MDQALTFRRIVLTVLFAGFVLGIFALLIGKHYEIEARDLRVLSERMRASVVITAEAVGLTEPCEAGQELVILSPTSYVCSRPPGGLVYAEIYRTYPSSGGGREIVYSFLDRGSRAAADEMLENEFDFERYNPVVIDEPITWTEDPYGERYWRFLFYSLRPTRNLLAAARETDRDVYWEKLREITGSFAADGMEARHAWDDYHGAAFRTMILTNTWWKLREAGELPDDLSDRILIALEQHGDFLLDPEHYEAENNHAVTQAAALLVLAESFPGLPGAERWRATAIERIDGGLRNIVDEDGVLIENSPYYHLYVLEKYWEIFKYARDHNIHISDEFNETIVQMVDHSVYVLQPDLDVPLLGASIPREIRLSGEFREMAGENPQFEYVLTQGARGEMPDRLHQYYPSSGLAILRSGWGQARPYEEETFVVFDTGPYRTDHSDFDALTFSAYADGTRIIRDTGLFTYEDQNHLFWYFHGTRGHNTVMVDGMDQPEGRAQAGPLGTGTVPSPHLPPFDQEGARASATGSYAHISAVHTLYPGVTHGRGLLLIEEGALIVADSLTGSGEHTYEQLFHLAPGTELSETSYTRVAGVAESESGSVPFEIRQYGPSGELETWENQENPPRGLCSEGYEEREPCPELSYTRTGSNARYITIVLLGEAGLSYEIEHVADNRFRIDTGSRVYDVQVDLSRNMPAFVIEAEGANTTPALWERIRERVRNLF